MEVGHSHELELDNALMGFTILGRDDEEIGEVIRTSLDRTCLFVETGHSLIRRKKQAHAIHRAAIADVDPDSMRITVRATREQVENAPDYRDLDDSCGEKVERYYAELD